MRSEQLHAISHWKKDFHRVWKNEIWETSTPKWLPWCDIRTMHCWRQTQLVSHRWWWGCQIWTSGSKSIGNHTVTCESWSGNGQLSSSQQLNSNKGMKFLAKLAAKKQDCASKCFAPVVVALTAWEKQRAQEASMHFCWKWQFAFVVHLVRHLQLSFWLAWISVWCSSHWKGERCLFLWMHCHHWSCMMANFHFQAKNWINTGKRRQLSCQETLWRGAAHKEKSFVDFDKECGRRRLQLVGKWEWEEWKALWAVKPQLLLEHVIPTSQLHPGHCHLDWNKPHCPWSEWLWGAQTLCWGWKFKLVCLPWFWFLFQWNHCCPATLSSMVWILDFLRRGIVDDEWFLQGARHT